MAPKIISSLFRSNLFLLPTLITHAWVFPDELTHWRNSAVTDCLQLSWALKLLSVFVWHFWYPQGDPPSWPSHCEVNNIQLLHPALPPTSTLCPVTELCPSFQRYLFFFFFFLLCRWNSFCCHFCCCLFRPYLFYEKCCGCQNCTLAIHMGHISLANSTLLINTRVRISNTGKRNQQILHAKG